VHSKLGEGKPAAAGHTQRQLRRLGRGKCQQAASAAAPSPKDKTETLKVAAAAHQAMSKSWGSSSGCVRVKEGGNLRQMRPRAVGNESAQRASTHCICTGIADWAQLHSIATQYMLPCNNAPQAKSPPAARRAGWSSWPPATAAGPAAPPAAPPAAHLRPAEDSTKAKLMGLTAQQFSSSAWSASCCPSAACKLGHDSKRGVVYAIVRQEVALQRLLLPVRCL
jgi:hypothetical protein